MTSLLKIQLRWKLKECPRCKGDLNYDSYFNDWTCLQCGYVKEIKKKNNKNREN